jgi:hypothetical protein
MKTTVLALFLLGSMAAQAAEKSATPAKSQIHPSPMHGQVAAADHDAEKLIADSDKDYCYTMRVYMFEAKDGESPRPKGVETCVASNPRILQKTAEPKAQFKLLK